MRLWPYVLHRVVTPPMDIQCLYALTLILTLTLTLT